MKKIALLLLTVVLTVTLGFSQTNTKIFNFKDIKGIDASSIFKVHITKGNSSKVKVTYPVELESYLDITASGSTLNCNLDLPRNYKFKKNNNNEIIVELEMNTIKLIDLSGASAVIATGSFTTQDLKIDISGASRIKDLYISGKYLEVECSGASSVTQFGNFDKCEVDISGASKATLNGDKENINAEASGASLLQINSTSSFIKIDISGASKSTLSGACKNGIIGCSGASILNAKDMKFNDATVSSSGASKVNIYAINSLKADASSGSIVNYYGNPQNIITKPSNIRKGD